MIFDGHLVLLEKNKLRHAAMKRKQKMIGEQTLKIEALEFDALECLERIFRENPSLPFTEVVVLDGTEGLEDEEHSFSKIEADGKYKIYLSAKEIARLEHYVEEIFGNPWSELRIRVNREHRGIDYYQYSKPIYEFPYFAFFSSCKINLRDYIFERALWFIVLHEYAHIQNGHLHYKSQMKSMGLKIPLEVQQSMEMHADITAASYLLDILYDEEKYIGVKQIVVQKNGKNPGTAFCDDIIFATIAAYLALRCFLKDDYWDEYTIGFHQGNRETHPLVEMRMSIVFNVFLQGILRHFNGDDNLKHVAQYMLNAVEQFEEFYFQNKGHEDEWVKAIQYNPTQLLRTKKGKEYYYELFENVLKLNETLRSHTHVYNKVEGEWYDYETLPERMFWD